VFPVDFDGGENVYRVHPINVQLVTDPVIMPAKEEHGCDSGSEILDKNEPHDILYCHVERRDQSFAVAVEFVMMVALSSKLFKEH
jgi:hypothetical protein